MEDKETELLSRVAANHLLLGQFEPFRAMICSLRARSPEIARTILQTVIAKGGRVGFPDPVLWSASCPSPALLTFMCTQELLHFPDPTSGCWSFDPNMLKLRAEFLLYLHIACSRVLEKAEDGVKRKGEEVVDSDCMDSEELRILGKVSNVGLFRLRSDLIESEENEELDQSVFDEGELMKLCGTIIESPDIFDALCANIREQLPQEEKEDSSLAITVRKRIRVTHQEEKLVELLKLILKCVQVAHLDAMRWSLEKGDEIGAVARVRFLDVSCGLEESEYRIILQDLLKTMLLGAHDSEDATLHIQNKVLSLYKEAISSHCTRIVQILQLIQDNLLLEEVAVHDTYNHIPLSLWCLRRSLTELRPEMTQADQCIKLKASCKRAIYHYARLRGLHVFDLIVNTALSLVQKEMIQEASQVLSLFPRLQPLVSALGWDLLVGKTTSRRNLMRSLWISKHQALHFEESSSCEDNSDKVSCVEHLCDTLCYWLDIASFVACINSGQFWNCKSSLLLSGKSFVEFGTMETHSDPFVENFVLERLSVQSPLRVILDLVPRINYQDAIELLGMQPIMSAPAAQKRMQDIELLRMRYALDYAVLAIGAMENSVADVGGHWKIMRYVKELSNHLDAIKNISRKVYIVNIIISLLHMNNVSVDSSPYDSIGLSSKSNDSNNEAHDDPSSHSPELVSSFIGEVLRILKEQLPLSLTYSESSLDKGISAGSKQGLEWRFFKAKSFIEDWEWRLTVLHWLLPSYGRQVRWKEALIVLHAAPSKLLNICMQREKFDIGEETISRYSLSQEDKAMLGLTEWVDRAFQKASVEDVHMHTADDSSVQDLNFLSWRSELGPLAAILLCIDVAVACSKSTNVSLTLLNEAQVILSEIYPGGAVKIGSNYWDQVYEMALISVMKRVLRHLFELLEQYEPLALPDILSGKMVISSSKGLTTHGNRDRALVMLDQMIEDAYMGKRQFLSGKLHNLARAIADVEREKDYANVAAEGMEVDLNGIIGLGFKTVRQSSTTQREHAAASSSYDVKDVEKSIFRPVGSKNTTFLSQFILHIAAIGDIVDGRDSTDDFNYFSLVYEYPKDLLTRLLFEQGNTDAAGKAAEIMNSDFVHEIISACIPPVYPPRSGHGWASIPVIPAVSKNHSEAMVVSPSSREAKEKFYTRSSAFLGVPLYPLKLDIVKHLVKLSAVRAILACVLGSTMLHYGNESSISSLHDGLLPTTDVGRSFYEFALDQSERFPTLNRWIQMQTNLHRVSEVAFSKAHGVDDSKANPESKVAMKRYREDDPETDSEDEDFDGGSGASSATLGVQDNRNVSSVTPHESTKSVSIEHDKTNFLSFDWENEGLFEKAIERMIDEDKLYEAFALSDRVLRSGASDSLLQLLIIHEEENTFSEMPQSISGRGIWSNSWKYCLRLKDKVLAATLALKYLHKWELQPALDILTMCICHLADGSLLKMEVIERRKALCRYKRILCADECYGSWQEVEMDCKEDPEGLALRLAEKGEVSAALEVAESEKLSVGLCRELQGRQLVKLLGADPINGGGPAEASRFLSSLRDSEDALPVAISAMQLLPNLKSKQLLVHFFLKRKNGNLSEVEVCRLNTWALGLRVLATLPLPWQQRCSSLHEHPQLILEVLLMRKQLESASVILKEFPQLRNNNMILVYATKAIAISVNSSARDVRVSVSGTRQRQRPKATAPAKPSFSSSLSNIQKEARRAFSWSPRNSGDKVATADARRKRKNSVISQTEKVAWEAMSEIQEAHIPEYTTEGQDRLHVLSIAAEWMLTGDLKKDEAVRSSHHYDTAPDITLFRVLLSLCSDEMAAGKGALDLCVNQIKNVLSSQSLPDNASVETIGRAYHATETFVQGLLFAKAQLRKFSGTADLSSISEKIRDTDDASPDAASSSMDSQSTDELSEALSLVNIWVRRAELLQSLLGSGIAVSLDDVADEESSARLRDRLIQEERYSMAVYTCKKCKIDAFPVWYSWGHALLQINHYAQARVKFKQALQLYKGDAGFLILEIISAIEDGPPVDVSSVRSMYEHLSKSEPAAFDYPLSADSYLKVLYMPSISPRSEKSRRFLEASNSSQGSEIEEERGSNLDNIKYLECLNYLQEYARQHLLTFLFRHDGYKEACLLFFPANSIPHPSQSSLAGSAASSPQRPDPLATDYGTVDDLCELCVAYGAMDILEEVILSRSETTDNELVTQHTAAAVNRICVYAETHKYFNYLYKFLVIKKDHVAAGLCCIQLFINSVTQDVAIKHLENAKMHFDEGLSARYRVGDQSKPMSKVAKGKSASERLTEEGLVKFSARVTIQIDIVRAFNEVDKPQWKYSIFGNPNDPETFRRRCKIAETLAEKNFDLVFRVIYEFNLPAVDIYAGVASSLAERKKGGQLTEFLRNIKGTIDDDDWDQVLGAAINVYANKHKERPDRLIDMLTSSHRKVLACVVCGRLKTAFQIASRSGSVSDVQYVAHQALHANAFPVLDMCKQWLANYM